MSGPTRKVKNAVIHRDGYECRYCGRPVRPSHGGPDRLTFDHVVPASRDGSHRAPNLVVACGECNEEKGDSLPTGKWRLEGMPGQTTKQAKAYSREHPKATRVPLTQPIGDLLPDLTHPKVEVMDGHGLESKWLEGCDCAGCTQAHTHLNGLRSLRSQPRVVR